MIKIQPYEKFFAALFFITVLLGIFMILFCPKNAHAFTDEQAIRAIIGEAENQNYTGMVAVACAIRNRGTLKGVYGLKAITVKNNQFLRGNREISNKVVYNARKAWFESYAKDITNGATHWENIKAFGCPSWVKNCVQTFKHKDHVFYKEVV